ALELYRGDFLAGHYHDWIPIERERLRASFARASLEVARERRRAGDVPGAIDTVRGVLVEDPLNEDAARELMDLFARSGEPSSALRALSELAKRLDRE